MQFAMDCAQRLLDRHADSVITMTAFCRLEKLYAAAEAKDKDAHADKVKECIAHGRKMQAALDGRANKSMVEWAEWLNMQLLDGKKADCADKLIADLKAAPMVKHDLLVRIYKKSEKMGANMKAIKAACDACFPDSEFFKAK